MASVETIAQVWRDATKHEGVLMKIETNNELIVVFRDGEGKVYGGE